MSAVMDSVGTGSFDQTKGRHLQPYLDGSSDQGPHAQISPEGSSTVRLTRRCNPSFQQASGGISITVWHEAGLYICSSSINSRSGIHPSQSASLRK